MPFVVYLLASAVLVQATSEFMLAGLVTEISDDLGVPVAAAGGLTSAFAVGMVVGAPLMAVAARRLPPRTALAVFLSLFVAVHVVGAVTVSFGLLAATRVLAAFANAGFLAVALSVVVRVVPPEHTARATAPLLAGTTLALIAGVPAGAVVGQGLGWRATFWAVAVLGALALVGVLTGVPSGPRGGAPAATSLRHELRILSRRPVVAVLAVAALVNGATFAVYTYLGPMLTGPAGLPASVVPVALASFGAGAFAGVLAAGRLADTRYRELLVGGGAALVGGWAALAVLLGPGRPAVVLLAALGVLGALGFAVGATAIARSLGLAAGAGTLGGAVTTAALNVGATLGPLLGGWGLSWSGAGPAWVAAGLVALAVGLVGRHLEMRPIRRGARDDRI